MTLPVIILFAKVPVPGRVKTRLQPFLSAGQACALHEAMVRDALEMLGELSQIADIELHMDVPTESWPEFPYVRRLQPTGDLGCRLQETLRRALDSGRPRALILGSDSPGLFAGQVGSLLVSAADVKIGPTLDGGFFGISASRTTPLMFERVHWSTASTLADTLNALKTSGLSVEIGWSWFDIDEPQDLLKLSEVETVGRHTVAWFTEMSGYRSVGDLLSNGTTAALKCPAITPRRNAPDQRHPSSE